VTRSSSSSSFCADGVRQRGVDGVIVPLCCCERRRRRRRRERKEEGRRAAFISTSLSA